MDDDKQDMFESMDDEVKEAYFEKIEKEIKNELYIMMKEGLIEMGLDVDGEFCMRLSPAGIVEAGTNDILAQKTNEYLLKRVIKRIGTGS